MQYTSEVPTELQEQLEKLLSTWHGEVRTLLPTLPDSLTIELDNQWLIPDEATGGLAVARDKVALAFDPEFKGDRAQQFHKLRGSYFHECFHVVQGFVGDDAEDGMAALDNGIYEGAATVFEREHAGTSPGWGEYGDRATMLTWLAEVQALPANYDWQKWKFYDPATDRRWILYRVGTFVVDEALRYTGSDIATLAPLSADEIFKRSELS